MRVNEVIAYADKVYANQIDLAVKIRLLQELDRKIATEVFAVHEGERSRPEEQYTESTELLVGAPYEGLYRTYLLSQLAMLLGQAVRYQNYAVLYDSEYSDFARSYNREHAPLHRVRGLRLT